MNPNLLNQLPLKALRYYVAVCRESSFSQIAKQENVSPSMISRTISQLENALGTTLLYRNTRSVTPTEAGQQFFEMSQKLLADWDKSVQSLHDYAQEVQGLVRINAPVSFTRHHIMPYLTDLTKKYPKLQLELTQTDSYIDPHQSGADLNFRIGSLADSALHARILGKTQYALYASPDYLRNHGNINTLAELQAHKSVVFKGNFGVEPWLVKVDDEWQRIRLPIAFAVNDGDSLLNACESSMGVAMLADWLVQSSVEQGKLVPILTQYQWVVRPDPIYIAMIYPNEKPPRNVRAVMDFFVEKLGKRLSEH